MAENEAFRSIDFKKQENIIQDNDLINTLWEKTDKSSEALNALNWLQEDVNLIIESFNKGVDEKVLVWNNYIAEKWDISQTFEWAKKVNEQDFDAAIKRIEWQLNVLAKSFNWNYEQLKNSISSILNVEKFINSLNPSTLATLPFSWKFKENIQVQVTKKWEATTTAYNWLNKSRTDYLNEQIWKAGG